MIRSINDNQTQILKDILALNNLERFDADLTYGNGAFYKEIPKPEYRFDIDDTRPDTITCDSANVPLPSASIQSCVFDPPFLTYVKEAREHNSVMAKRFGGYWAYAELEQHYRNTIHEAHRLLGKKGILVFKCQDIIHNHKMHPTHSNILKWAENCFRLKDMFVLTAKHRMTVNGHKNTKPRVQKHARVYHSYFLVLERLGEPMTTKKLSDEDVRLIRQLDQEREKHRQIANSLTRKEIGIKFGISPSRVFDICTGLSYKHVED